jgi:hypothetical protein
MKFHVLLQRNPYKENISIRYCAIFRFDLHRIIAFSQSNF